ncbi:MAG TPA: MFS transporter [Gemmatimonadaceae bacterium]|nr:MFS transporter [Gemmatimonadaceae bacterium]
MPDDSVAPKLAGRREWIGVSVLTLPCLLLAMDLTVLHLAVPALSADLSPTSSQLLWIVDIYGFLIAGSLITMGTLGDRIGRRRLLLIGAAAFGIASAMAAFSKSAEMLIATRALLGVAGATLMPSTLALIRNMFHDPRQRTVAIAIWLNSFMAGGALGPLLGGVMLEHFWWGSVFLLNVPVMVLLLVLGPLLLPENRDPNAGRLDLLSAALSLIAMLAIIYGIKKTAQDGLGLAPMTSIVAGLVLATVFVIRQRSLTDPLIDLRLFQVPAFSASVCTQLVSLTAMAGIYLFVSQYMQLVIGLSPLEAGLWTLPWTVAGMIASMLTPALARRVRPAYVMGAGLLLAAIGMAVLTQIGGYPGLGIVLASFIIIPVGLNPAMTLTTDLIMSVAPPDRAGAASAISETSSELGLALGMAILGSVGTASYRQIMDADELRGLPADAAEAARSTLGGAVETGARIGGQTGTELIATARDAFAQSLELVASISALVVLTMAIVAVAMLRRVDPTPGTGAESDLPAAA